MEVVGTPNNTTFYEGYTALMSGRDSTEIKIFNTSESNALKNVVVSLDREASKYYQIEGGNRNPYTIDEIEKSTAGATGNARSHKTVKISLKPGLSLRNMALYRSGHCIHRIHCSRG